MLQRRRRMDCKDVRLLRPVALGLEASIEYALEPLDLRFNILGIRLCVFLFHVSPVHVQGFGHPVVEDDPEAPGDLIYKYIESFALNG